MKLSERIRSHRIYHEPPIEHWSKLAEELEHGLVILHLVYEMREHALREQIVTCSGSCRLPEKPRETLAEDVSQSSDETIFAEYDTATSVMGPLTTLEASVPEATREWAVGDACEVQVAGSEQWVSGRVRWQVATIVAVELSSGARYTATVNHVRNPIAPATKERAPDRGTCKSCSNTGLNMDDEPCLCMKTGGDNLRAKQADNVDCPVECPWCAMRERDLLARDRRIEDLVSDRREARAERDALRESEAVRIRLLDIEQRRANSAESKLHRARLWAEGFRDPLRPLGHATASRLLAILDEEA